MYVLRVIWWYLNQIFNRSVEFLIRRRVLLPMSHKKDAMLIWPVNAQELCARSLILIPLL